MSGTTTNFGEMPRNWKTRTEAEQNRLIDELSRDDGHKFQVDRNSPTWKAIMQEIKELTEIDYQLTLRNRNRDHDQTQYARGALDAFDCLLRFGGEEV